VTMPARPAEPGSYQETGSRLRHASDQDNHDRKAQIERLQSPVDAGKADNCAPTAGSITPSRGSAAPPCQPDLPRISKDNGLGRVTVTVTNTGETDRAR
jgi:hypothetical protein